MRSTAGLSQHTSPSLFMETFGFEVEEDLSTLATQYWAEGVWIGKWPVVLKEAWMKQLQEIQSWRQVRGQAGAVMCETRDLGTKWPHWHTLIFEGYVRIDMRDACPKDVKMMLLQQVRSVYWKRWTAKHEFEELKEGIWLEFALALLRKKTKGGWTEKHRNVARKLVLEGGWVQKKLFDAGWSVESECQACHKEEGTEKHRLYHCPEGLQRPSESGSKKREPQKGVEVAKKYCHASSQ